MCYAKPGPRCTSHARATLQRAIAERAEAHAAVEGLYEQYKIDDKADVDAVYAETGEIRDIDRSNAFYTAHPYGVATRRSIDALDALNKAQAEYDATPGGIADLKAEIAAVEEAEGDGALASHAHQNLTRRLTRGQEARRDQLEHYNAVHGQNPSSVASAAPGHDAVEDEVAAQAPPPPCSCIEYRYKNDCSHISARIEGARKAILPNSQEASLELHAARSRHRSAMQAARAALDAAKARGLEGDALKQWTRTDADYREKDMALYRAAMDLDGATAKFWPTPAGEALLREQADAHVALMGYETFSTAEQRERADAAAEYRADAAARFTELTGQPAPPPEPAEVTATPPNLMYGESAACPEGCKEFAWTGKCADTDPDKMMQRAFVQAMATDPDVQRSTKAIAKGLGVKTRKPGLLSRLTRR